ncbi:DnaJ domain-containing protein [Salaquimonas pukyongi]|uniref:DnaJ domain-containing protein n=1 Tax=Salaquimonas pukyongi TaxID=2712698 RepID=UPI00096BBAEE|nr:DnaJ domain-containing protein [Salaquimonas pukyongi]
MTAIFYLVLFVFFAGGLAWLFVSTPAERLARGMKTGAPLALVALGGLLTLVGRGGFGIPLAAFGLALWQRMRATRPIGTSGGARKSTVRSAALEMELDLDTGEMEGRVLAGAFEGKTLSALTEEQLLELYGQIGEDPESGALLEAYLDRRMPLWREHADPHGAEGERSAPASGTMTKQEAYQILGLEPGASPAEIRKAWRKLMKSVHPDSGGTEFLAAKINAAKDVLLD